MSITHRSKNSSLQTKTNHSKSLMKGSLQTKQQSTCRNTPKQIKNSKNKNFKKNKNCQNTIKTIHQFHSIIQKLNDKLSSFDQQSLNISLKSQKEQTIPKKQQISENILNSSDLHQSPSTSKICQSLQSANQLPPPLQHPTEQPSQTFLENYAKLFNRALCKLTHKNKFTITKSSPIKSHRDSYTLQQHQIRQFKKNQNTNWNTLNKQLSNFINNELLLQKNKYLQFIKIQLLQQGKINYKWFQIQQQLSEDQLQLLYQVNEYSTFKNVNQDKINSIQSNHGDSHKTQFQSSNFPQLTDQLENSQQQKQLTPQNYHQQLLNYQQIIQLILNSLLLQFTSELAYKLDTNALTGSHQSPQQIQLITSNNNNNQLQTYHRFLHKIDQVANDSSQLDLLQASNNHKNISPAIISAFIQVLKSNPSLTPQQSKQKLKHLLFTRKFDIKQIIKQSDNTQYQLIKLSLITELSQYIFSILILGEIQIFIYR